MLAKRFLFLFFSLRLVASKTLEPSHTRRTSPPMDYSTITDSKLVYFSKLPATLPQASLSFFHHLNTKIQLGAKLTQKLLQKYDPSRLDLSSNITKGVSEGTPFLYSESPDMSQKNLTLVSSPEITSSKVASSEIVASSPEITSSPEIVASKVASSSEIVASSPEIVASKVASSEIVSSSPEIVSSSSEIVSSSSESQSTLGSTFMKIINLGFGKEGLMKPSIEVKQGFLDSDSVRVTAPMEIGINASNAKHDLLNPSDAEVNPFVWKKPSSGLWRDPKGGIQHFLDDLSQFKLPFSQTWGKRYLEERNVETSFEKWFSQSEVDEKVSKESRGHVVEEKKAHEAPTKKFLQGKVLPEVQRKAQAVKQQVEKKLNKAVPHDGSPLLKDFLNESKTKLENVLKKRIPLRNLSQLKTRLHPLHDPRRVNGSSLFRRLDLKNASRTNSPLLEALQPSSQTPSEALLGSGVNGSFLEGFLDSSPSWTKEKAPRQPLGSLWPSVRNKSKKISLLTHPLKHGLFPSSGGRNEAYVLSERFIHLQPVKKRFGLHGENKSATLLSLVTNQAKPSSFSVSKKDTHEKTGHQQQVVHTPVLSKDVSLALPAKDSSHQGSAAIRTSLVTHMQRARNALGYPASVLNNWKHLNEQSGKHSSGIWEKATGLFSHAKTPQGRGNLKKILQNTQPKSLLVQRLLHLRKTSDETLGSEAVQPKEEEKSEPQTTQQDDVWRLLTQNKGSPPASSLEKHSVRNLGSDEPSFFETLLKVRSKDYLSSDLMKQITRENECHLVPQLKTSPATFSFTEKDCNDLCIRNENCVTSEFMPASKGCVLWLISQECFLRDETLSSDSPSLDGSPRSARHVFLSPEKTVKQTLQTKIEQDVPFFEHVKKKFILGKSQTMKDTLQNATRKFVETYKKLTVLMAAGDRIVDMWDLKSLKNKDIPKLDILQTIGKGVKGGVPVGVTNKASQLVGEPTGVRNPEVQCFHQGMRCCVPKESVRQLSLTPPFLGGESKPQCKAEYIPRLEMYCSTVNYDNKDCHPVIVAFQDTMMYRTVMVSPHRHMNDAVCECMMKKTSASPNQNNKKETTIHGSAHWLYSKHSHVLQKKAMNRLENVGEVLRQSAQVGMKMSSLAAKLTDEPVPEHLQQRANGFLRTLMGGTGKLLNATHLPTLLATRRTHPHVITESPTLAFLGRRRKALLSRS